MADPPPYSHPPGIPEEGPLGKKVSLASLGRICNEAWSVLSRTVNEKLSCFSICFGFAFVSCIHLCLGTMARTFVNTDKWTVEMCRKRRAADSSGEPYAKYVKEGRKSCCSSGR